MRFPKAAPDSKTPRTRRGVLSMAQINLHCRAPSKSRYPTINARLVGLLA
jgi:hypothetical protein